MVKWKRRNVWALEHFVRGEYVTRSISEQISMCMVDGFGKPCGTRRMKNQNFPFILLNGFIFLLYVVTMITSQMGMLFVFISSVSS
jgi:hypothetical protein